MMKLIEKKKMKKKIDIFKGAFIKISIYLFGYVEFCDHIEDRASTRKEIEVRVCEQR